MKDIMMRVSFGISAFAFLLYVSGTQGQEVGIERPGGVDLATLLNMKDSAVCKIACDDKSNCYAYSYDISKQTCYLKATVPSPKQNEFFISGIKSQQFDQVRFGYRTGVAMYVGGVGGTEFCDNVPPVGHLTEINLWSVPYIHYIQAVFNSGADHGHGRPDFGIQGTLKILPNERLVRIYGMYGWYIDQITFVKEDLAGQRTETHFGGTGGEYRYEFMAPQGFEIAGFCGRAKDFVDAIGVVLRPVSDFVTIQGHVYADSQHNCIYLNSGGETYQIDNAVPKPTVNTSGTVSGVLANPTTGCPRPALTKATWRAAP